MQAMVLAAGLGTRLRPHTLVRPKPLFPVLNRPLLDILLDLLEEAGCGRIVVNGHHLASQVEEAVTGRRNLFFQYEPEILGTGGSLRQAVPHFGDEPILVMNGDIFHTVDILGLYRHHIRSGNRITMAMHDYPRFNTVAVAEGTVRTFRRAPDKEGLPRLAFTGIHIVDPAIVELIPSGRYFHSIDLYEELIGKGERIECVRVDGSLWRDIGTVDDYLELHGTLLTGKTEGSLPLPVPCSPWLISRSARVPENTEFTGWGCIGKAVIGGNVRLHNCIVWDEAVIPDNSVLENTLITSISGR